MKRPDKKKLVLTKRDRRVLVLAPSQLQAAAGASGILAACINFTTTCTRTGTTFSV